VVYLRNVILATLRLFGFFKLSFPGGMKDNTDKDLIATALRETHEEIGLDVSREAVWGSLQGMPSTVSISLYSFPELKTLENLLSK
jgi:8-oxo-dGTP pyrophosphatase MutT (NUDIX family)